MKWQWIMFAFVLALAGCTEEELGSTVMRSLCASAPHQQCTAH